MKRLFVILLTCSLLLLLCACNSDTPKPTPSPGAFRTDESVLILENAAEIDADNIRTHLSNKGIVAVFSKEIASALQEALHPAVAVSFEENDRAVLFYMSKYGAPATYTLQSNADQIDADIDDMIETIRRERQ